MTQGHLGLTEKERQALRLLTAGYDAKSMALHLGLSVHTVNERLRDARRKMATSSSREAARQLREIEGPAPEKPVHAIIGDATQAGDAPDPVHQASQGKSRLAGWITGGIAMSLALAFLALAALSASDAPPPSVPPAASAESTTVVAARAWLALVDQDNWDASWDATGKSFKSLNTSAKWAEVSNQVRASLGAFKGRELVSAEYAPAPPYGYWIVKFRANYANKANATETVSLERENDSWRVVGVTVE
ncbi:DUF4019 domain-containing protein [Sandarakinorhabdus sp.]|uniref:DUF4019 domain-containing protein n=1 Tax=Sandarakinorhabdus sp. TaxID=1916663 RepID=UPI00286E1846|nr:DUF4019 domain-containing protein [Sandarakinorhabdus sp.]